ncbi:glutathione S-transferase [Roseobacter weihaiensis]|uniref:glutathione S-transferase n=1 Tax=Roseobacter weihaiensis TaxID=2763262 RepID=UPI001D09B771|nr:glutathione S-transferase [Roseobacter sp. H9]
MKLFHSPASPYVRKVVVLLHELEKTEAVALETITTTAFASDEALKAANPLGRIPALERAEGATLYDSRVITSYLNDLFGGTLYPQGSGRWETLTLEATGDGIMDSAVSMSYEKRLRPEAEQSDAWVEAQWSKISRALSVLNTRWMSHLSGPLTMAHISVGCALSYLDFRHGPRNWRQGNEALAAWHQAFDSRPSMQASRPPDA